jgi:hypothetical protein
MYWNGWRGAVVCLEELVRVARVQDLDLIYKPSVPLQPCTDEERLTEQRAVGSVAQSRSQFINLPIRNQRGTDGVANSKNEMGGGRASSLCVVVQNIIDTVQN